jgi:predicted transcriptional regulator
VSRYTVDLGDQFDETLGELAAAKHTTKSDIIRRALASYAYLNKESSIAQGKKVSITNDEDRVLKDIVLP